MMDAVEKLSSETSLNQACQTLGVSRASFYRKPELLATGPNQVWSWDITKMMKYRPRFPARFGGYEDARSFFREFFRWYNVDHYHTGKGLLTPNVLHYGKDPRVIESRAKVLQSNDAKHPERFVRGCPKPQALPSAVWINPPTTTSEESRMGNTPLIEIQTPSEPIGAKTELDTSPLTSAETSTRPQDTFPNRAESQ